MTEKFSFLKASDEIRRKYSIYVVLALIFIAATLSSPVFLSVRNLRNVATQISILTIMAFGQTMLIIAGMLDLSVGSVMAFSGLIAVIFYQTTGSLLGSLFVGMIIGTLCGVVSAIAVTRFKVPPFIATLGMLTSVRGLALLTTNGQNVYEIGEFVIWGQSRFLQIPTPIWFMAFAVLVTWYLLRHTRFGRYLFAIGGNEEAARASGIRVSRVKFLAYLLSGLLVGLAGVIYMGRVNAGLPNAGIGFELTTISIAVIGGTSISGGVGSAGGTLAGAFILGFINNIMNLLAVPTYVQQIIRGAIIVTAVAYDVAWKNKKRKAKVSTVTEGT